MDMNEIKAYCIKELEEIDRKKPLLDIFYIILKDHGKSYMNVRTAWLKTNSKQLNLFKEVLKWKT